MPHEIILSLRTKMAGLATFTDPAIKEALGTDTLRAPSPTGRRPNASCLKFRS